MLGDLTEIALSLYAEVGCVSWGGLIQYVLVDRRVVGLELGMARAHERCDVDFWVTGDRAKLEMWLELLALLIENLDFLSGFSVGDWAGAIVLNSIEVGFGSVQDVSLP